jgi:tetratricopeptide (TPR) repeat protein
MDPNDPRIGVVLDDRYRIVSHIATGSMGVIYRAERLRLGRAVAIKVLHIPLANKEEFIQRFEREARALSRLSHPNCVSIIDFGVADAPYLVMDYVPGRTLRELVDMRPLPPPRVLHIFRQILAGLAHAHGHGIIHRDVKPGNVMITEATGTGDHIRILDFGLSKLRTAGFVGDHTGASRVIGTPSYISPEAAEGVKSDIRADLYSAGVMLFEMLTGVKPFDSDDMLELLEMHKTQPPPSLRNASQGQLFSEEIEGVVLKALAKDRRNRFQTAMEFAAALDATPEAAQPLHRFYAATKHAPVASPTVLPLHTERSSTWVLGFFAGLIVAAGLAGGVWWLWQRQSRPRPAAAAPVRRAAPVAPAAPVADLGAPPEQVDGGPDSAAPADLTPSSPIEGGLAPDAEAPAPDAAAAQKEPPLPRAGIARVYALLRAGRRDDAIAELIKLRYRSPKSAEVEYRLGRLYFDKRWWTEGMKAYRAAIHKNPVYRNRRRISIDVINALTDKDTMRQAEAMILKDLGRVSLPHLERAAKRHENPKVRKRAAALIPRLR